MLSRFGDIVSNYMLRLYFIILKHNYKMVTELI